MMRQISSWMGAAVFLLAVSAAAGETIAGKIPIKEISGAAFLPGDRLLLVADVLDEGHAVFQLEQAAQRLKSGNVERKDFKPLTIKTGAVDTEVAVADLQVPQELKASMAITPAKSGFNIEGAAFSQDGRLLLGLRAPLDKNGQAIVLEVKDPCASPLKAEVKARLDLKGGGIRGMFYDPEEKGFWILAGLSPDPEEAVADTKRSLWLWRDDGKLEPRTVPNEAKDFTNAETVTRVSVGGQPHLLLVEDATVSRYLLFPVPTK